MGRILALVLGLAVLGAIAWKVMYGGSMRQAVEADAPSAPKQQLDNVRGAANRIETNDQQHVDEVEKKAFGNE
ncbi:MAG: hypothetical protein GQE15_28770 [Archangiaceae bacterium]|nr:hypothetical protein [Archangiaceae bacterium]